MLLEHNISDKYCKLPYEGLCIDSQGDSVPCCAIKKHADLELIEKYKTFDRDNAVFCKIKDDFNSGVISEFCKSCKTKESQGVLSHRQIYEEKRKEYSNNQNETRLRHLDIAFGNTCNLTCVMCSNKFSSKWNTLTKTMPEDILSIIDRPREFTYVLSYEQIDSLLENCENLNSIVIKGGEPFYDKKTLYFLDNLTEINSNVNIQIVSNLTIINVDLIKQYPNIKIMASIDGVGKIYEWIRGGNFSRVSDNFDILVNAGVIPHILFTTSSYNLENLQITHDYFRDKGMQFFSVFHAANSWLNYNHLGSERVEKAIGQLSLLSPQTFPSYNEPSDTEKISYLKYTEYMNNMRKFDWQSINPQSPFL